MSQPAFFNLKVQQFEKTCAFELSWGKGQQLTVTLPYPEILTKLYQEWQRIYLNFYKTALRGRVEEFGSIAPPPIDWHAKLVQAEAKLLYEFHQWLRSRELYDIRAAIAGKGTTTPSHPETKNSQLPNTTIDVFLTCNPLDLARLPWEAWEIATEFALSSGKIRIVRTPINIRQTTQKNKSRRSGKARILAILGDDTGLNFQAEKEAMQSLGRVAEIEFVGWQPGQSITELKNNIIEAIAAEKGWDILFFAGHSNENNLMGGEIGIAPNAAVSIGEITQALTVAKERGLQFAIFNSCNGLSIAHKLIDLGLSQVAVMREPIHNRVAEEFLIRFLQALAEYKDVHECLQLASQYLKLEKNLTYPSAYLIPSLFSHPDAELFRLEPIGIKHKIKRWLPTTKETIALAVLLLISSQLPLQRFLLERRVLVQAVYRQVTNQLSTSKTPPPVLLVQIDEQSIREAKIANPRPLDRKYLASLVDKISAFKARVVGVDVLLDRHHGESDRVLAKSLKTAVGSSPKPPWFVFAAQQAKNGEWLTVLPDIASLNWSLEGNILTWHQGKQINYMTLWPKPDLQAEGLSFAYLLSLAYRLNFEATNQPPQPQLQSSQDFLQQLNVKKHTNLFSEQSYLQPITTFSYQLGQVWLQPIFDFSIPPSQVYNRIPAWQLLKSSGDAPQLQHADRQIVILAAGGYGEAGASANDQDNYRLPPAVAYWRSQNGDLSEILTGGEVHAYTIHHFLNNRLIVPIPDLWMVAVAAILGKVAALSIGQNQKHQRIKVILLVSSTAVYGLVSLQIYITSAILLPWLLPSLTFCAYALPGLLGRKANA